MTRRSLGRRSGRLAGCALAGRASTVAALALTLVAPATAHALRWRPCSDFPDARCSRLTVPLDRTGVDPGRVRLRIADLGRARGRPALMYLSGGPGGAGVSEMLDVAAGLPELMQRFRVIGFDQRGTGRSGLLRCPEIERDVRLASASAAAACARRLGPARRHYTTPDSVADMESIRRALGIDKLTLFGISYGTELALEYARAHPDHVARMVLDSTLDPDADDPFETASFRAMAPSLRALCPAACAGISADPAGDLATLVRRLLARPATGTAYDGRGRPHRRRIRWTALLDYMFNADYDPALRAALPAAVRAALARDTAPLARLLRDAAPLSSLGPPEEFSSARFATICEETPLPWAPGTPLDQRAARSAAAAAALGPAAFSPFQTASAAADEVSLCLRWPDVPRPVRPVVPGPDPAVPTLILQGGEDLRTPPEESARVAARLPGAIRVVVPGVGHGVSAADPSGCGERAVVRFLAGRTVARTCRRVRQRVPAVPPPPSSFSSLAPVAGLPARVGRTLRAVLATLADVDLATSPVSLFDSGGGLRGGSWAIRRGGRLLVLRRYETVPGVTVSGRLAGPAFTLRIGGRRAARGSVRLRSGGVLSGRLGGHPVDVQIARAARAGGLRVPALPRRWSARRPLPRIR
ncbi:MAG TPA: alpha/beta fold hydrolase [Solirubrobacteraceae bacterium]|jgi:pimeloyl-ACP methyl ester carboxylesterase